MQRMDRKTQRQLKRAIKAAQYRAKGEDGQRARARRVSQMLHEQLKAENGVERLFEGDIAGIEQFEAEDKERELDENDAPDAS
jgi:hypothetical protein